jgi:hypothetical protein
MYEKMHKNAKGGGNSGGNGDGEGGGKIIWKKPSVF